MKVASEGIYADYGVSSSGVCGGSTEPIPQWFHSISTGATSSKFGSQESVVEGRQSVDTVRMSSQSGDRHGGRQDHDSTQSEAFYVWLGGVVWTRAQDRGSMAMTIRTDDVIMGFATKVSGTSERVIWQYSGDASGDVVSDLHHHMAIVDASVEWVHRESDRRVTHTDMIIIALYDEGDGGVWVANPRVPSLTTCRFAAP